MSAAMIHPEEFTEREAARRLNISVDVLRRDRARGRVRPMVYGKRTIRYNESVLEEYRELCRNGPAKSADIGSANDAGRTTGAEHGSMPPLGRQDAHRLAQATFGKRS